MLADSHISNNSKAKRERHFTLRLIVFQSSYYISFLSPLPTRVGDPVIRFLYAFSAETSIQIIFIYIICYIYDKNIIYIIIYFIIYITKIIYIIKLKFHGEVQFNNIYYLCYICDKIYYNIYNFFVIYIKYTDICENYLHRFIELAFEIYLSVFVFPGPSFALGPLTVLELHIYWCYIAFRFIFIGVCLRVVVAGVRQIVNVRFHVHSVSHHRRVRFHLDLFSASYDRYTRTSMFEPQIPLWWSTQNYPLVLLNVHYCLPHQCFDNIDSGSFPPHRVGPQGR